MSKALIAVIVLFAGGVVLAIVLAAYVIGVKNTQAGLQVQYDSKLKANNASFDNMWKKIQQTAQVTDAQKNALKEIMIGYAQARGGNGGGSMATSVREAIPNVDTKVFQQLMNIITGSRDQWTAEQIQLVDVARQYNFNLSQFPKSFILDLFGYKPIDAKLVTSSRTDKAFETGKDDDTDLGLKK